MIPAWYWVFYYFGRVLYLTKVVYLIVVCLFRPTHCRDVCFGNLTLLNNVWIVLFPKCIVNNHISSTRKSFNKIRTAQQPKRIENWLIELLLSDYVILPSSKYSWTVNQLSRAFWFSSSFPSSTSSWRVDASYGLEWNVAIVVKGNMKFS